MSALALDGTVPAARRFAELLRAVAEEGDHRFALAELNDLLTGLAPADLREAVSSADLADLSPHLQNYVAAMVELASQRKGVDPPPWTREVAPLDEPWFATDLPGLRLHLLRSAPLVFKRRNLFIDASIGDRV
jgi:hypothetical protein